jgi:uncharacterized protein YggU (UPF0235/DUF167 family)
MKFLEKNSDFEYIIRLNVKTNSKIQKLLNNNDFLTVFLKSKPIQNKANIELINLIKKKLHLSSSQIQIISGYKNRDKSIKIIFNEKTNQNEIIGRLFG